MNPLTRLLLGPGRLSEQLRAELTGDDLLLLDEELTGSITLRHYRDRRRRSSWSKSDRG